LSQAFQPKSYLRPNNEAELSKSLKELGDSARIIAGGTGIYEIAHRGLLSDVETLVDISGLGLSYVKSESGALRIGAATTMSALFVSKELTNSNETMGIIDALKAIQPLQVKNVATVGGSICTALPFFDLPVALLSMRAKVRLGPTGSTKPLSDFVNGYFSVDLSQGEFVKEIEIPLGKKNSASAFQKFAITHDDWALINCGVSVSVDENKHVSSSTIFFGGGVPDKPVQARSMENSLVGIAVGYEHGIKEIFDNEVSKELEPLSDIRASSDFRLHLAKVIGRRTFIEALRRI
jgi:CO/xanthine dehydrogenase FAD-binding subunit